MTAEERADLTRDVAHIVAEALSPAMNTMARGFERLVSLEERQEKLLEHIVTTQERMAERQDQIAEALALIIEKMRRS